MSAPRFDRRILSRAKPEALLRLAKFIGINISDKCICYKYNGALLEVVVRKLDQEDKYES